MQTNKTLKQTINVLSFITDFLWIVSMIMIVVSFALIIFGIFISSDFLTFDISDLEGYLLSNISGAVQVSFPISGGILTLKELSWRGGILGIAYASFFFFVILQFRHVFKSLKVGRPFDEKGYRSLRLAAYAFMVATIIIPFFEFIFFRALVDVVTVPPLDINFSLNINYLWIGLMLYVLAKVFEYGNELQSSFDETI